MLYRHMIVEKLEAHGEFSKDMQTTNLEAYHSTINNLAPKMNKFSYKGLQSW